MTREEADFIGGMNMCDEISNEAYRKIMCHCEEQEPCEDCISREHLLEEIASLKESPWFKDNTNCSMAIRKEAIEIVEDLCIRKEPSINSQKIGHWIYDRTRDCDGECKYECSECGMGSDVDYAYCMRCGAKMVEPQESEDKE